MFSFLGNGIYIIVEEGSVVVDEGTTIREEIADTVQDCEDLCDTSNTCESFRYCKGDSEDFPAKSCILKDKVLTGNEPTIFVENCASYYTAGRQKILDYAFTSISFYVILMPLTYTSFSNKISL